MNELDRRNAYTNGMIADFRRHTNKADGLALSGQACVYATGSVGRLEAGEHSDMDLVIVTKEHVDGEGKPTAISSLSLIDEIRLKANIIEAMDLIGIKRLDGDGNFFVNILRCN